MNCSQCNESLFDYVEDLMDDQAKQAIETHIETCETCQQALEDMQTIQTCLTQHGQKVAQIRLDTPVLGAIVRGQKKQLKSVQTPLRSIIMKSPIFKLAVAAAVVIACTLGFTLLTGTQNIALADVLTRIEQVQAYLYQMNMTITQTGDLRPGQPGTQNVKGTILMSQDYGTKLTMDMGIMVQEQYVQPHNKRMLMIMPEQKKYVEMELNDQLLDQYKDQSKDPRYMIEQILNCEYAKIGKSEINGIEVEGFQTTDPAYAGGAMGDVDVTIWVSTENWLPVQVDMEISIEGEMSMHMKGTIGDFEWDVPVEASVFNPVIPDDYTTIGTGPIKMPEMTEATAIAGLKLYRDFTNEYPEDMGMMAIMGSISKMQDSNTPAAQAFRKSMKDLDKDTMPQAVLDVMMPIQAASGFYALLVQQKKEPAYYGDTVTPDQPDLILMRWKLGDDQYRVIFSDLTAETVTALRLAELEAALPRKE